jgi:hypothetical protein
LAFLAALFALRFLRVAVGSLCILPQATPNFLGSAYLPWIVAFFWRGVSYTKFFPLATAGLLAALTLFEGGVYSVLQALLLVAVLPFTLLLIQRTIWPIICVAVVTGFFVAFAAPKLFPALILMRLHPRPWSIPEMTPLRTLFVSLFSRNQDLDRASVGAVWRFWEDGAYIGPIAPMLAVVGIASSARKMMPWLVASSVLVMLIMGDVVPDSPWFLLHKLPIFSSERVPSRFGIPLCLACSVFAAAGADLVERYFTASGRGVLVVMTLTMVGDFWLVSPGNYRHIFYSPVTAHGFYSPVTSNGSTEFHQIRETYSHQMLAMAMANRGALNCYEYAGFHTAALGLNKPGYRGEQYLLGSGSVQLLEWTPNILRYAIDTAAPTVLIINQNYYSSWHLMKGAGTYLHIAACWQSTSPQASTQSC